MTEPYFYDPPTDPITILYRDDDLLVTLKPSGLLSVPGKPLAHRDCLETRVIDQFPTAKLVHRLDRGTSGLLIFGLNHHALRHLGLQFEKRYVEKTYIALVLGKVIEPSGTIDLPLRPDWKNRPKQIIDSDLGKPAITTWQRLTHETLEDTIISRIALFPKTGRSHQLRVHMKSLGHPILGDNFYGAGPAEALSPRLMLHAQSLKFRHPTGGREMNFTDPCPF